MTEHGTTSSVPEDRAFWRGGGVIPMATTTHCNFVILLLLERSECVMSHRKLCELNEKVSRLSDAAVTMNRRPGQELTYKHTHTAALALALALA